MSLDKFKQLLEDEEELIAYRQALSEKIAEERAAPKQEEIDRRIKDMLHDIETRLSKGLPVPITDAIREAGIEGKVRDLHRKYEAIAFMLKAVGPR